MIENNMTGISASTAGAHFATAGIPENASILVTALRPADDRRAA
jgi:hypothetical protein